jgi:hypothetical protein
MLVSKLEVLSVNQKDGSGIWTKHVLDCDKPREFLVFINKPWI